MQRNTLKEDLRKALGNPGRARELFLTANPAEMFHGLCRFSSLEFSQFLRAVYGEHNSVERYELKKYADSCADAMRLTAGDESDDEDAAWLRRDKCIIYGLWALMCSVNLIDPVLLTYVYRDIIDFFGETHISKSLVFHCKVLFGVDDLDVTEEADWRFITANYASQEKFLLEENLNKRKIDQDNLFYINLNHADLCDNLICDVYMDYAGMERTNFASCIIHSSTFNFSYLHAANFHKCIIRDSSFYHANLTDADFSGATLTNVNLTNCQLMGANFKKAKLVNVTFFSNINFSDISNMNVVFNMLTGFTKYQANNGFDVLKTAILDDFLRQVASINNLNTQKIWLNLALKNYFFGTHQTGPLESCNRFFYDKNQLADANLIYTASQRTLRTVLRQVLIDIEQAQLTAPIDLRCEPILLHH